MILAIRYPITLSTTEPNNDIGLLKIRQADEETQTLVVDITANGQPKSYDGLQAFFCAKLGQSIGLGIIEQKLEQSEMTNPKTGQLEYTFRPEDWQQIGRQTGYFSFRKMKDDGHEYVEQFTTRDFYFNVTKNVFSEGLTEVKKDGSTYVWTIEDLIRLFNEYISSGKSDWEEFVDQNREIIESVDPGGLVLTELIDSRKSGGIVYPSLADRLNNTDQQNNLVKSRLFFGDNNVLIGHRGCSGFAPENSKKAFELAYHHGMAGIETDLTNTSDGVIFCYHDETLDTKTDGTGNPRELTWDYVSTVKLTKAAGYDAYPDTKIATLDDYLSVAKKYNLIIFPEVALSTEDLIHEALDKIYLYGLQSQCVILVNKWNYQIVKDYAPNLIRCLIPSWGVANTADIDFCVDNGIEICGAAFSGGLNYVPQSFIDYANAKGIYLYGYIINATKDLSRIKDLGIKFIGTDFFGGEK